jgi:hypothetical protein
MPEAKTYERTHYEAVLDIRWAIRYNLLLKRVYRRLKNVIAFAELFAGSAAFAGAFAHSPHWLSAAGGLTIAALAIFNHVISPAETAACADEMRRRYTALDRLAPSLPLEELDARIKDLRESDAPEIEPLRWIAQRDMLIENGRDDIVEPLTRWQRLVSVLA